MSVDIKNIISTKELKKIFGNAKNGADFYFMLTNEKISTSPASKVWEIILRSWNYDKSLKLIREQFIDTEKYKNGKKSEEALDVLLQEWKDKNFGSVEWPFSQAPHAFDNFVQSINSEKTGRDKKDCKVKSASVRYRRIKEINTARNDFIETLIFEKNKNIMPTLRHSKGVDFFVDGMQFDQKVSRSVTKEFKEKHGDNWKKQAMENPQEVAEFLYTYQNETRFDPDPRLYVVYIDEDVSVKTVQEIINNTNLEQPIDISFTYTNEKEYKQTYKTKCFIILLYNKEV